MSKCPLGHSEELFWQIITKGLKSVLALKKYFKMFEVDVKNMMDEKEKKDQVRFWVLSIFKFLF